MPGTRGAVRAPHFPVAPGAADEAAVRVYGEALGKSLRAPVVIALHGDLGAGKTTLAQAIARGAGVRDDVTSPTFALVHQYAGRDARVYHIDLYRLDGPHQLTNLGWDDIIGSDAIVLIEWPERAADWLPSPRLDVSLGASPERDDVRVVSATWTE